jgi:hypothetical protein
MSLPSPTWPLWCRCSSACPPPRAARGGHTRSSGWRCWGPRGRHLTRSPSNIRPVGRTRVPLGSRSGRRPTQDSSQPKAPTRQPPRDIRRTKQRVVRSSNADFGPGYGPGTNGRRRSCSSFGRPDHRLSEGYPNRDAPRPARASRWPLSVTWEHVPGGGDRGVTEHLHHDVGVNSLRRHQACRPIEVLPSDITDPAAAHPARRSRLSMPSRHSGSWPPCQ